MADSDFRIQFSWRTHWKRKLIKRRLGAEGVLAVEDLWAFAAENQQTGDLGGMPDAAIEAAAAWEGESGWLIAAMVEARLIDGKSGSFMLHDWAVNQPWIAGAPDRQAKARHAASKREEKRKTSSGRLRDVPETSPFPSLPSPSSPSLSPSATPPEKDPPTPTECPPRGGIRWDGVTGAFVGIAGSDLERWRAAIGRDPDSEIARCALHWAHKPPKDCKRALDNWMKKARPASDFGSRRNLAEAAWLQVINVINGWASHYDPEVWSAACGVLEGDAGTASALTQFGRTTEEAVTALREMGIEDRNRQKRVFVDAHLATGGVAS